jgi:hypothetical protein
MAGINFASLRAVADKLIGDNGTLATLTRTAVGGDPWNPTAGADADTPVYVVESDRLVRIRDGAKVYYRGVIMRSADGITPTPGDKLTIGSAIHIVGEVKEAEYKGVSVVYEVELTT